MVSEKTFEDCDYYQSDEFLSTNANLSLQPSSSLFSMSHVWDRKDPYLSKVSR